jgi:hypothetical protein
MIKKMKRNKVKMTKVNLAKSKKVNKNAKTYHKIKNRMNKKKRKLRRVKKTAQARMKVTVKRKLSKMITKK